MYKRILSIMLFAFALTACSYSESKSTTEETAYTTETATETSTEEPTYTAQLCFTGDLMVHQWQLDDAYNAESSSYDFNYCFAPVYDYLQTADLTIGNLETVFAGADIGYSDYPMFNTPDEFAVSLKNAGFNLLTTANNHSMDKGEAGILRTLDTLDSLGIEHFGTYRSEQESLNTFIKDVNGIKLAFVSATYGVNGISIPDGKDYLVNILDEEKIKADIKKAAAENPDFIIVMPHIGNEYEEAPKDIFKNWIDIMIKAGADMVIASHPHVLQQMEYRTVVDEDGKTKKAFVAFSMGNFISSQRTIPRDAGVILNISLSKKGSEKAELFDVYYVPTWVQWKDTSGSYNIRTLPVYDAILDYENEDKNKNLYQLRKQDYQRLLEVNTASNKIINSKNIDRNNMQSKYKIE